MARLSKEKKEAILELYYDGFKECSLCGEIKPVTEFFLINTGLTLLPLTPRCKQCLRIFTKLIYRAKKNKVKVEKSIAVVKKKE